MLNIRLRTRAIIHPPVAVNNQVDGVAAPAPLPDAETAPPPVLVTKAGEMHKELNWASHAALQLAIQYVPTDSLSLPNRHPRRKNKKAIRQVADSIENFGFNNPICVGDNNTVRVGVVRLLAAKELKLSLVPIIRLSHLTDVQLRLYSIADNKLSELSGWDDEVLAAELAELDSLTDNLELTGFSLAEIEDRIHPAVPASKADDDIPERGGVPVSQLGDIFIFEGGHRVICGDARDSKVLEALMQSDKARIVTTDPPYGIAILGMVSGKGRVQHREFVMGAKGTTEEELLDLLTSSAANMAAWTVDGGMHFIFMDFRHMKEIVLMGEAVYKDRPKQVCVWVKASGGMGSFYRSQHEFCFIFKVGSAPHINNFGLGGTGRYRTNCWFYDGQSGFHSGRDEELAMHPTVKPVAMIMDVIKDCSNKGDIVLDGFGGSGTTLVAAHKTKRRARLVELDPLYVDVIIRRFQSLTGTPAIRERDGRTFDDIFAEQQLMTGDVK